MIRQGVECSPKKGQSSVCLGPLRSPPIQSGSGARFDRASLVSTGCSFWGIGLVDLTLSRCDA